MSNAGKIFALRNFCAPHSSPPLTPTIALSRALLIAITIVLLAISWMTWITPLRDWRIFLVTFTLASLRALTAMVLIGHRDRLDRHIALVFAAVLLIEAAAMLIRSITVMVGDLPSIGADSQSTTTLTRLAVLFAAVLSTPPP